MDESPIFLPIAQFFKTFFKGESISKTMMMFIGPTVFGQVSFRFRRRPHHPSHATQGDSEPLSLFYPAYAPHTDNDSPTIDSSMSCITV
jgi:hypothetical protein